MHYRAHFLGACRCISNAYNNLTQVRRLFLQHSTIVSFRYLPQLPYLEELGIEGNRIASFAHAPCLPSLISVNITGEPLSLFSSRDCVLAIRNFRRSVAALVRELL
jgi:hypothetical protein